MKAPVLLDTQLLVLLVVGATSLRIIPRHKNLTEFTIDDFKLLIEILGEKPKLVLLPNIVAEAASLLRQHREPERSKILLTFKALIHENSERYVASKIAVENTHYLRLGVTDAAIMEASQFLPCQILTTDAALFIAASAGGSAATNFNHKREAANIL